MRPTVLVLLSADHCNTGRISTAFPSIFLRPCVEIGEQIPVSGHMNIAEVFCCKQCLNLFSYQSEEKWLVKQSGTSSSEAFSYR